ncbi:MAG: S41 family peptidase [Gemmatimonadaceae bacterium]
MGGAVIMMWTKQFGFERVQILAGNIGYLDVRAFCSVATAGDTAARAMQVLAGTGALVIDLSNNRGGDAAMGAWLSSFLFDTESALSTDSHDLAVARASQFNGQCVTRYLERDVYVVVGRGTSPVALDFAFALQRLGRATVVADKEMRDEEQEMRREHAVRPPLHSSPAHPSPFTYSRAG